MTKPRTGYPPTTAGMRIEVTDKSKIEGSAKRTAETVGEQLRERFKEQGWIK